jgi:hypothetical protein
MQGPFSVAPCQTLISRFAKFSSLYGGGALTSLRDLRRLILTNATQQLRIVACKGLARGDRKWSLNDGRIPNVCGVRVHVSAGYTRVEGNRRASRNGRVSDLPPETPNVYDSQLFASL